MIERGDLFCKEWEEGNISALRVDASTIALYYAVKTPFTIAQEVYRDMYSPLPAQKKKGYQKGICTHEIRQRTTKINPPISPQNANTLEKEEKTQFKPRTTMTSPRPTDTASGPLQPDDLTQLVPPQMSPNPACDNRIPRLSLTDWMLGQRSPRGGTTNAHRPSTNRVFRQRSSGGCATDADGPGGRWLSGRRRGGRVDGSGGGDRRW